MICGGTAKLSCACAEPQKQHEKKRESEVSKMRLEQHNFVRNFARVHSNEIQLLKFDKLELLHRTISGPSRG
jgi:hypothetical protein